MTLATIQYACKIPKSLSILLNVLPTGMSSTAHDWGSNEALHENAPGVRCCVCETLHQ